jgi:parallel beta-helix repeat protein
MRRWLWSTFVSTALLVALPPVAPRGEAADPPPRADAGSYFVAPDGREDGDGSAARPWPSVEYALSRVGGGQTLILKPGVYRGPVEIAKQYAGTRERPTVVRSEIKWKAVVIGAPYHVISNADGCDWVTIDGFEVLGARYDGIKMNGDHNVVRNCWSHNNAGMGIAMHGKKGGVIENNLIEFNGGHVQFHHGVYADGDGLTIRGNIVRHNAAFGLHLYPSLKNSVVANNLVYGHTRKPGIIVACPDGGGKNVIVNNTVVSNKGGIDIWDGNGEVVANNIVTANGEALSFNDQTKNVHADYNLCLPESVRQGPHGITGDPRFVDPEHGAYWLRPDSPAIGRGTLQDAPRTDFWGRPLPRDRAPDLGAFPFVPFLATDQARAGWYSGWAYRFSPGQAQEMPDFWAVPVPEGSR